MASESSSRALHGGEPEPEERHVVSIHVSLDHRPQSDVVLEKPKDSELASKRRKSLTFLDSTSKRPKLALTIEDCRPPTPFPALVGQTWQTSSDTRINSQAEEEVAQPNSEHSGSGQSSTEASESPLGLVLMVKQLLKAELDAIMQHAAIMTADPAARLSGSIAFHCTESLRICSLLDVAYSAALRQQQQIGHIDDLV